MNSLAIDGGCRQIHLPHATFSHVQSLHRSHRAQMTCVHGSSLSCVSKIGFHRAPHRTLNTSTRSLSLTSLVLLSSSPNPDLLSTHPLIHCEDPRQDGSSTEFYSSTSSAGRCSPLASSFEELRGHQADSGASQCHPPGHHGRFGAPCGVLTVRSAWQETVAQTHLSQLDLHARRLLATEGTASTTLL